MVVHLLMRNNLQTVEELVPIPGFDGAYLITRAGRIWSVTSGLWLQPAIAAGYQLVTLCTPAGARHRTRRVHRLVATTFIPNPLGLPWVNHIDGNKANNNVENLEWVTPSENMAHAIRTHLHPVGERSRLTKLKNADVIQLRINHQKGFEGSERQFDRDNAAELGVSASTIRAIINRTRWKHIA